MVSLSQISHHWHATDAGMGCAHVWWKWLLHFCSHPINHSQANQWLWMAHLMRHLTQRPWFQKQFFLWKCSWQMVLFVPSFLLLLGIPLSFSPFSNHPHEKHFDVFKRVSAKIMTIQPQFPLANLPNVSFFLSWNWTPIFWAPHLSRWIHWLLCCDCKEMPSSSCFCHQFDWDKDLLICCLQRCCQASQSCHCGPQCPLSWTNLLIHQWHGCSPFDQWEAAHNPCSTLSHPALCHGKMVWKEGNCDWTFFWDCQSQWWSRWCMVVMPFRLWTIFKLASQMKLHHCPFSFHWSRNHWTQEGWWCPIHEQPAVPSLPKPQTCERTCLFCSVLFLMSSETVHLKIDIFVFMQFVWKMFQSGFQLWMDLQSCVQLSDTGSAKVKAKRLRWGSKSVVRNRQRSLPSERKIFEQRKLGPQIDTDRWVCRL